MGESSPHSEDPDAINGKNKLWSKSKTANLRLTLNGTWERESLMFTKLRTPTDLSVWSESSSQPTSLDAPLEPTSELCSTQIRPYERQVSLYKESQQSFR